MSFFRYIVPGVKIRKKLHNPWEEITPKMLHPDQLKNVRLNIFYSILCLYTPSTAMAYMLKLGAVIQCSFENISFMPSILPVDGSAGRG